MTHFLDITGKIADLKDLLSDYEERLSEAEMNNNVDEIKYLKKAINETKNKISGMENSPYYNNWY